MDILAMYLVFSTLSPFFLWKENRLTSIIQIPFAMVMWVYFVLYIHGDVMSSTVHNVLLAGVFASVILSHVGIIIHFFGDEIKRKYKGENYLLEK
ncbi:spore morphogenesis/germination protein YwcE [Bacillus tianshenii]|nr:spore morphogenesis/germination protein YwcE [Bacillus tianshenii]